MELYNLRFDWHKIADIDMMSRMRKLFKEDSKIKSFKLDDIANHFLGKGKIQHSEKIIDLYNNNRNKLREYNITDVVLLKELDEKLGIFKIIGKQCSISKTLMRDFKGIYVSELIDNLIIKEAHKLNLKVPTKIYQERVNYTGGLVFEPISGMYKNVYVFDFTSLYPSIIIDSNIGFDTINQEGIINPGTGIKFSNEELSIISKTVKKFLNLRQDYKNQRLKLLEENKKDTQEYESVRANELIMKELANSVYGVMGLQSGRYFSIEIADFFSGKE